jgi:hypothetical protein
MIYIRIPTATNCKYSKRDTCKEYPEKAPGNCSAIISIAARKATT